MDVLDENCISANAKLDDTSKVDGKVKNEMIGIITYETYFFTKPAGTGGLSLISFAPEKLKFGCEIGHNVANGAGVDKPPKPQGKEFKFYLEESQNFRIKTLSIARLLIDKTF